MNQHVLTKLMIVLCYLLLSFEILAQNVNDLKKSVPLWFQYDDDQQKAVLHWLNDPSATSYSVSSVNYAPAIPVLTNLGTVTANVDSFQISGFEKGKTYRYRVSKSTGMGFIDFGIEQPPVPLRGRCLLVLDDLFTTELQDDIKTWMQDIRGDGWMVDTIWVDRMASVPSVRQKIINWAKPGYNLSQSVVLFGHIPVPYSGSTAIDGHQPDHLGAWPADLYYGDINGVWTDNSVNITGAARAETNNIPGDGKFDQVFLPSDIELEVGRIDFYNLPAFSVSEKDLLKNYLQKNHKWRKGLNLYPNSAIMENNFPGFEEGFGQNAWRNFLPMFGKDAIRADDYENILINEKHVFSFACGGGSYTSCGGIGSTQNLWAAKDVQTVFTMTFGSYFGDWDTQNNFLRGALASGDILTNAWAGRPNWLFYPMASGAHIGYCTRLTQNANTNIFSMGFGARYAHTALMGDPTLRLHPVPSVTNLQAVIEGDSVRVFWDVRDTTQQKFRLYYSSDGNFEEYIDVGQSKFHVFSCLTPGDIMEFMVRPLVLTTTASGSYYNLGCGEMISLPIEFQNLPQARFTKTEYFERVIFENNSLNAETYEWDFGDQNFSDVAQPTHLFEESGSYLVCLRATKNDCLSDTFCETIEIFSSLPQKIDAVITQPLCFGELNGKIEIQTEGGSIQDLSFLWNDGTITQDISNIGAGNYTLTITSQISGKSIVTSAFFVDQPEPLVVLVEVTPSSGMNGSAVIEISGGTEPYNISWNPNNAENTKLAPGTYTITVTDVHLCSQIVSFVIEMASSTIEYQQNRFVYPNPSNGFVIADFVKGKTRVLLIQPDGKVLKVFTEEEKDGKMFDLHHVLPGLYYIVSYDKTNLVQVSPLVIK